MKAPPNRQNKSPTALAGRGLLQDQAIERKARWSPVYSPRNFPKQAVTSETWIPLATEVNSIVGRLRP